jgi:O-antigen/teichoic acid export membrane protein
MYYNQSVWYKLTGKTSYGAAIAIFGALITLGVNVAFIPLYGYMASAWATLICYASMMVVSYALGRKHYPVPYAVGKLTVFIGGAVALWWISVLLNVSASPYALAINLVFLVAYLAMSVPLLREKTQ